MMFALTSFLFVIIIQRVIVEGTTTSGKEDGVSKVRRTTLGHMVSGRAEFTGFVAKSKGGLELDLQFFAESGRKTSYGKSSRNAYQSGRGSINQVEYGSTDLSQEAIRFRQENNITGARNIAVYEYENNGQLSTIAGASQRNQGHAERLIAKELENMGIQPAQVRRIYSELEPCSIPGGYCKRFLQTVFPQADVTYSFEYGLTQESRRAGVNALKEAGKNLFK